MNQNIESIAKDKQREYLRDWRAKNRQKTREYAKRYWLKKAEQELQKEQDGNKEA